MYQLLSVVEGMNNEDKSTTIRNITEHLKKIEPDININIINCSIRHYRKNGLVRRKHDPYKRPFEYELSKKGVEQLKWVEDFINELLLDIDDENYIYGD